MESSWNRIQKPYQDGWALFKNPQMKLQHFISYSIREQVKGFGFYTNSEQRRLPLRRMWHMSLFVQIIGHMATMITATFESLDDVVSLGLDITFSIAAFFILFRMVFLALRADQLDLVVDALDDCYRFERIGPGVMDVRATKRAYFLAFVIMSAAWMFTIIMFVVIFLTSPFWMESQSLPFHESFPFQLQDPSKHPIAHAIIYLSQVILGGYLLIWLVLAEALCMFIFLELACTLSVLKIELRHLLEFCNGDEVLLAREVKRLTQFHQRIIYISERLNDIFKGPFIIQLMINFALISLSVFEFLALRHNLKVGIAYLILMIMTLGHLSCWSKFGDLLSEESLDVSLAAYEAYNPSFGSRGIHRDLGFIMHRAQEPLVMRARPFPNFNLTNYMAILKQCYSILTILLQTLE